MTQEGPKILNILHNSQPVWGPGACLPMGPPNARGSLLQPGHELGCTSLLPLLYLHNHSGSQQSSSTLPPLVCTTVSGHHQTCWSAKLAGCQSAPRLPMLSAVITGAAGVLPLVIFSTEWAPIFFSFFFPSKIPTSVAVFPQYYSLHFLPLECHLSPVCCL